MIAGLTDPTCPRCNWRLPARRFLRLTGGVMPIEGAFLVCPSCFEASVFDEQLLLTIPSEDDAARLKSDRDLQATMRRTRQNAARGKRTP